MKHFFLNYKIDKQELKRLLSWFVQKYGSTKTTRFADTLKYVGFHYAMQAGISIGLEDLQIPVLKYNLVENAKDEIDISTLLYERGEITAVEKFCKVIDTWAWTSENVKKEVVRNFEMHYPLNPVYMMASSGARGNMAQVRQLIGMRGLMSDPKGDLLELAIQTNFREGLTVVEYIISCYGSRKGVVDTALRTANSGYLTRRLIEVAQEVSIYRINCFTKQSFPMMFLSKTQVDTKGNEFFLKNSSRTDFSSFRENTLIPLEKRLVGRVLAKTINRKFAVKNRDISPFLAQLLGNTYFSVPIRSPFTCNVSLFGEICQLCYGWGLADSKLVSIGDAVGVIAAQSIGEPGTQLTMRTFHTGGVFSKTVVEKLIAPSTGFVAFSKISGQLIRTRKGETVFINFAPFELALIEKNILFFFVPPFSLLFVSPGQYSTVSQILAESVSQFQPEKEDSYFDKLNILANHSGQIVFNDLYLFVFLDGIQPSLSNRHGSLWILSGEVLRFENTFLNGDLITTYTSTGSFSQSNEIELRTSFWNKKIREKKDLFLTRQTYLYSSIYFEKKKKTPKKNSFNKKSRKKDIPILLTEIGESLSLGQTLNSETSIRTDRSGYVFQITKSSTGYSIFMRELTIYAVSRGAIVYSENNSVVSTGDILFELQYTREKTGDIVQGLPKIEQLFEARQKKGFDLLVKTPKNLALCWFFSLRSIGLKMNQATFVSLQVIKYFLLNSIQRVYHTQGVAISDKHFEVIINQMCSIVLVIDGGWSRFVQGELVNHHTIRKENKTISECPAQYLPFVLGITQLGLLETYFLSAASFQQTRKVLMAAALIGKKDTLDAMKLSIMIGKLIPVGMANTYVIENYISSIHKPFFEKFFPKKYLKKKEPVSMSFINQQKKNKTENQIIPLKTNINKDIKRKRGPYKKKREGVQIEYERD